jgi:hypothetical protein
VALCNESWAAKAQRQARILATIVNAKGRCFSVNGVKVMSPIHVVVSIVLVAFFCVVAPVGIFVFAKCFTGRGWTFMDYNRDEYP